MKTKMENTLDYTESKTIDYVMKLWSRNKRRIEQKAEFHISGLHAPCWFADSGFGWN